MAGGGVGVGVSVRELDSFFSVCVREFLSLVCTVFWDV